MASVRALGWFLLLPLAGCLTFTTHDDLWPCDTSADCEDGEQCRQPGGGGRGVCAAPDVCLPGRVCEYPRVCLGDRCQMPKCRSNSSENPCGDYACDETTYTCHTSCSIGLDCAEGNVCADGACVKGRCSGSHSACGEYTDYDGCQEAKGCSWSLASVCVGTPTPCASFTTMDACPLQQGCAWGYAPGKSVAACVSSPLACGAFASESACAAQGGCAWQPGCVGVAAPCSAYDVNTCNSGGCTWGP